MNSFQEWWHQVGSAMTPYEGDDMESHARRIAREAWNAAVWMEAKMSDPRDAVVKQEEA